MLQNPAAFVRDSGGTESFEAAACSGSTATEDPAGQARKSKTISGPSTIAMLA